MINNNLGNFFFGYPKHFHPNQMEFLQNSRSDENAALKKVLAIFEREGVANVIENHDTICELRYQNWSGMVVGYI